LDLGAARPDKQTCHVQLLVRQGATGGPGRPLERRFAPLWVPDTTTAAIVPATTITVTTVTMITVTADTTDQPSRGRARHR